MKTFFRYFFGTLLLPGRTFRRLKEESHSLMLGFQAVVLAGILFALTAGALAVSGAVPMAPVFLPLPAENYFVWEMVFILPFLFFIWGLVSMLVHLIGRSARKGGSFRKTLSLFGFALAWPVILLWVPQTAIAFFYALGMSQQEMVDILSEPGQAQIIFLSFIAAAFLVSFGLSSIAARVSQSVGRGKGLLLGFLAESVIVAWAVLFIR